MTTLPVDVILNSILRDNILYSIGQLSLPELMIVTPPQKLSIMVDQYITNIVSLKLKIKRMCFFIFYYVSIQLSNRSTLSYEHLHTLGNLIHFIPTKYLSLVDERAFKFMVESGLMDTRICVDSIAKLKWADLIIKAFG